MKRGPTLFLRAAILVFSAAVLALCIFGLPSLLHGGSAEYPSAARAILIIVCLLYVTALPYFIAVWQTFKLLSYIDKKQAFSEQSITALKNIKYCAIAITVLYFGIVPCLFPIAQADDAPGLILMGGAVACAPLVVAVFAATLQKLLRSAVDIQSENELTV